MLEPGYDADLVLFDRDAVRDNAKMPDKGEPDAPPDGIPYVMVNGVFAVDDGVFQNTRSGASSGTERTHCGIPLSFRHAALCCFGCGKFRFDKRCDDVE